MSNAQEYRKRQIIGLLLVAAVILGVALFRAPAHTVFPRGWWHVW
ncbi:hypothetical protein [Alloacidobacterium sp.]|nr:hypothetical protein [Alloacidobacterium sp.]HYK35626.1 hypothetical protein [Alloacidobacterium sp.]